MVARFFSEWSLHSARITRSATAFRRHPVDVLRRVLDIAGLAVHAILRVDPQFRRAFVGADNLVTLRRTVAAPRAGEAVPVNGDRQPRQLPVTQNPMLPSGNRSAQSTHARSDTHGQRSPERDPDRGRDHPSAADARRQGSQHRQ